MANSDREQPSSQSSTADSAAKPDFAQLHHGRRTADKQAAFLLPYLQPGMSLLDCGCGPGSITAGLARVVAPGEVVGIDTDPSQIERAQRHLASEDIQNLRFQAGSIYEIPFADNTFDVIFSHAVFMHLSNPLAALREMRRVVKSGGVIGIRNPDFTGYMVAGPDATLQDGWKIVGRLAEFKGGNAYMGKNLRGLLHQAGFANVEASASYDSFGTVEAVRHWGKVMTNRLRDEKSIQETVELGLSTREEMERMAKAYDEWSESPDAFHASSFCEVIGWKE